MILDHSKLFLAFRQLDRIVGSQSSSGGAEDIQGAASRYSVAQLDSLAGAVAGNYARSHALLDGLSRSFGFNHVCFWQPNIYLEESLTQEEQSYAAHADTKLRRLHKMVRERLRTRRMWNVHDLTHAMHGHEETVYIDHCHLTETANDTIAGLIVRVLGRATSGTSVR